MSKFFPEIHILFSTQCPIHLFTGTPHDALHLWSKEGAGTSSPTSRSPWVLGFIPTVHLGIAPSLVAFEPCALYPSDSLNHNTQRPLPIAFFCFPGVIPVWGLTK